MAKMVGAINLEAAVDGQRNRAARQRALILALEHLLGAARQIVPWQEGTLERSGKVTVLVEGELGAVSFNMPYAVRQHEELTWKHDPGKSAKYLELPMTTERAVMLALMAQALRREFG